MTLKERVLHMLTEESLEEKATNAAYAWAAKMGIPTKEAEARWKKAETLTKEKKGKSELEDDDYAYAMGIFKQMMYQKPGQNKGGRGTKALKSAAESMIDNDTLLYLVEMGYVVDEEDIQELLDAGFITEDQLDEGISRAIGHAAGYVKSGIGQAFSKLRNAKIGKGIARLGRRIKLGYKQGARAATGNTRAARFSKAQELKAKVKKRAPAKKKTATKRKSK